jgi:hypothetical protein
VISWSGDDQISRRSDRRQLFDTIRKWSISTVPLKAVLLKMALRTAWIKGRDNAIVSAFIGLSAAFDQWVGLSRSLRCPGKRFSYSGAGMSSPIRTFLPADQARAAGRIRISSSPISLRSRRFVMFYRRRGDVTSETSASSPSDSYINVTIPLTLASILPPSPIGSLTGG